MVRNRTLVGLMVLFLLIVPVASNAQTTNTQSNIITLLQQIISLQKQWIELLQNQIAQLSAQITNLQTQPPSVPSPISAPHICGIVNPPVCSTTLTVMRDSYNCVTSYQCALASPTTSTTQTTSNTSCIGHGGQVYANGSIVARCLTMQDSTSYNSCIAITALVVSPMLCSNGQWVSTTQTTGGSCLVQRHCGDLVVPNGGIAGNSKACGVACTPPSQCVNGAFVQVGTYATLHQYETSCPDDPYSL